MNRNPQVVRGLNDSLQVITEGEKFKGIVLDVLLVVPAAPHPHRRRLLGTVFYVRLFLHISRGITLVGLRTAYFYSVS